MMNFKKYMEVIGYIGDTDLVNTSSDDNFSCLSSKYSAGKRKCKSKLSPEKMFGKTKYCKGVFK